jgi:putative lipoprotein
MKLQALLAATIVVTACAGTSAVSDDARPKPTVSGTAAYRERIALPPGAVLIVRLVDVSRADAPATVLAEQRVELAGRQVPIPFEIDYDPAAIDARYVYAVQARIEIAERLLFITDRQYPVLTRGAPDHVELMLVRAAGR